MYQSIVWIPLTALAVTVLLHLLALKLFPRLGWLDFPERYGLRRGRLPYPTGILAIAVFLSAMIVLAPLSLQSAGLLIGIGVLGTVCFIDDRTPLPPWLRILTQVLVAFLIFATGTRIYTITNPLEGLFGISEIIKLDSIVTPAQFSIINFQLSIPFGPLPILSGIFTILWLGLTINALNWFDGIPGQVSALSTIGFLVIGLLAVSDRVQQPELALIAFVLAGISAGSFLFDFPPPRVLMGDTGAMFFGLMLGVLTIYAGGKVATGFLVLGMPLIDSVIVVARRIAKGTSPLRGDKERNEHLHHRLLAIGWSERRIILLTAVLGAAFGVSALFLSTREKFAAAVIFVSIMLGLSWFSGKK